MGSEMCIRDSIKTCLSKEREARLLKRVVEASGSIVEVRQREVETRGYTDDAECPGFGSKEVYKQRTSKKFGNKS